MNHLKKPGYILTLVCVAICSFVIGSVTTKETHAADDLYGGISLFTGVLRLVNDNYVEKVEANALIYGAINGMLQTLDPHSNFLNKESFQDMGERFSGNFYGIGIEFDIIDGYLSVISVIEGSPSEEVGLQSGDRIVKIDGESSVGIKSDDVLNKLRGEKGTKVKVTVVRLGLDEPLELTITRDKVPIRSIRTAFMLDDKTGYIQMIRFAKTTSDELEESLIKLEAQGMKRLMLDLRGNSGGYLDQAVEVSSKFLPEGKLVVQTRGRTRSANQEFHAVGTTRPGYPLIVLMDHRTASASEIVAGAIQDWDRGVIVGTRSFGKGLVQTLFSEPYLKDGSALKLTTAKYYTPSGRLIQRDYKNKSYDDYVEEAFLDEDGENVADTPADEPASDTKDHPEFKTAGGRLVYGGGGIAPDVDIKLPKRKYPFIIGKFKGWTPFDRACFAFANDYGVANQKLKGDFKTFLKTFELDDSAIKSFRTQVKKQGIVFTDQEFSEDLDVVKNQLKRSIARNLWGDEDANRVAAENDIQLQKAKALFNSHEILLNNRVR